MPRRKDSDETGKSRQEREKRLADALRRNLRLRKAAPRADATSASADDLAARLAGRLRETARAHHEAFAATDGADPDWAAWYAAELAADLPALLGRPLSEAGIAGLLKAAEEARNAAGAADWPAFYGRFLAGPA